MLTKVFWFGDSGVIVRALRTFAQTSLSMITVGSTTSLFSVDWQNVLGVSGLAAALSVLMALDRSTEALKGGDVAAPAVPLDSYGSVGCGDSAR